MMGVKGALPVGCLPLRGREGVALVLPHGNLPDHLLRFDSNKNTVIRLTRASDKHRSGIIPGRRDENFFEG
jgi:hypothetical protein